MEPTGETSSKESHNLNAKSVSVPESTAKSHSETEVLSSDSESSDFDREYTCDICDKKFSGLTPLKQHEKSSKHLKALHKQKLKKDIEDDENDDSTDEDFTLDRNQIYKKCEVCIKQFNGPESFRLHMRSKRHKKKVANSKILEESKEDGKVNVDKLKEIIKMGYSALSAGGVSDSSESGEDPTSDVIKCEICDKVFSGVEPFRDHMSSKTHRKTLKRKEMIQKLTSSDSGNTIEIVDGDVTCKLCHMSFSGPESALAHLKSKGHLEWLEFKKWKKERKNSEKQESELVLEASSSAEQTGESSSRHKEAFENNEVNTSAEIDKSNENRENQSQSMEARISYKKYKEIISKSEPKE